jgi:hypothetical protein
MSKLDVTNMQKKKVSNPTKKINISNLEKILTQNICRDY